MPQYDHERGKPRPAPCPPRVVNLPPVDERYRPMMHDYLETRQLSWRLAAENGWYPSTSAGDDLPRIVIPADGEIVRGFWQARHVGEAVMAKRFQSSSGPRGDAVVVVYPAAGRAFVPPVVIVEGPMCALAAAEFGHLAIALMGNTPPRAALEYAADRVATRRLLLVCDRDSAGAFGPLVAFFACRGNQVSLVVPRYKDLAASPRPERKRLLEGG